MHRWPQRAFGLLAVAVAAAALALGWGAGSASGEGAAALAAERQLAGAAAASGCVSEHAPEGSLEGLLAFLFFNFVACNVLDHVNGTLPENIKLPLSVLMLSAGFLLGSLVVNLGIGGEADSPNNTLVEGIYSAAFIDPHAVLFIILPPLLFESASGMTWHVLRKVLISSLILAIPGVILNTLLTGAFVKLIVNVDKSDGTVITWPEANLLASILSATDPVAVVASLTSLGAPPKLSTLVEGESLLNDGSAVVLFKLFYDMSMNADAPDTLKYCTGRDPEFSCELEFFMRMAVGGAALGALAGLLLMFWVGMARESNSEVLEVSLILSTVYAVFFIAEKLTTSGVLAVVALGFTMTYSIRVRQSHDGRHSTHTVLQQIGYHCNQVAFFVAGIVCARYTCKATGCSHDFTQGSAWLELGAMYVVIHLSRAVVVLVSSPFLLRLGYGLSLKEAAVLVWGGLRGAVGLILALQVEHNSFIDASVKQMIVFHVSGVVLLTLFVNAMAIDNLYTRLDIYPVHSFRRANLEKMLAKAELECQRITKKIFSDNWFFESLGKQEEELAEVRRCVPNFCSVAFSAAGAPYPVGICTVGETLKAIRMKSIEFRDKEKSGTATSSSADFKRGFTQSKFDEKSIRVIASEISAELCAVMDDMSANVNVDSTGHLDFNLDPERPHLSTKGTYISAKSLKTIMTEQNQVGIEPIGFGVKIIATSCVRTIIGFVVDTSGDEDSDKPVKTTSVASTDDFIDPFDEEELGVASRSIGLDCLRGVVRFRGPEGSSSVVDVPGGPVQAGEHVTATVRTQSGQSGKTWEVVFEVRSKTKAARQPVICVLGNFSAEELKPAVQLVAVPSRVPEQLGQMPSEALLQVKISSAWGLHGAGHHGVFRHHGVSDPYYCTCELKGGPIPRAAFSTEVKRNGLKPEWNAEFGFAGYRPEERLVFTVVRHHSYSVSHTGRDQIIGHAVIHCSDFFPHAFDGELMILDPDDPTRQEAFINVAVAVLDNRDDMQVIGGKWEPLSDTGLDASPDTGLEAAPPGIGDGQNLSGKAYLALNYEPINRATAEGLGQMFHVLFNNMLHIYSEKHEKGLLSDLALYWLTESAMRGIDCANNEVHALCAADLTRHSCADFGANMGTTMFEPLVVEWLSLESMIVDEVLWWDVVRFQAGRHAVVRAKVESIWAFVEAHTAVKNNAVARRYPQFLEFIDKLIEKSVLNMQRISDLQPARWYFAKYTMALRIILLERVHKLEGMVNAGLLTARDVGILEKTLRMMLAETETYHGAFSRWAARLCQRLWHSLQGKVPTLSNVWDYTDSVQPVS